MSVVTTHPNGSPSWLDLMTSDRQAATDFYGPLLGWTFEVGPPEAGYYTMCLKDGEPVAGIGELQADTQSPVAWTTYLAADDVDRSVGAVTDNGGQVLLAPMDVMGQGRMAVAADPTGAVFGMWQAQQHTGARRVAEPGAMCWHEVNTRDPERAARFYADVFGVTPEKMGGSDFDYTVLELDGQPVAGVYDPGAQMPADVPAHWMGYFAVTDVDVAAAQVTAAGGAVLTEPFDTPHGRMTVVRDPQGAVVSLIALAESPPG
jgi:predicted enzyme related to lactoylglutathione lyase